MTLATMVIQEYEALSADQRVAKTSLRCPNNINENVSLSKLLRRRTDIYLFCMNNRFLV